MKKEASVVLVAKNAAAVGVLVAITFPVESTARMEDARLARVSWPLLLKEEVADAPKKALLYTESAVVLAPPWNCWRAVQVLAELRSDAELVRQVPATEKQPAAMLMPLAKVLVAAPETLRFASETLPVKVEVPTPSTLSKRVVVAPPLTVSPPCWVPSPIVELPVAKRLPKKPEPTFAVFAFSVVDVAIPKKPLVAVKSVVEACVALNCPTTVEDACETKPLAKVWRTLQLFAVVVPNASERLLPEKTMG